MMKIFLLCLAVPVLVLAERRLIKWGEHEEPIWMTEQELEAKRRPGGWVNFIDVTDHNVTKPSSPAAGYKLSPIPTGPLRQEYVHNLIPQLVAQNIYDSVDHLSNFYFTRHRATAEGEASATWIMEQFIRLAGDRHDVSVQLYEHPSVRQPSVLVTIQGDEDELVVIGGHFDSTAGASSARAPGADDDACGTMAMMEAFRVLMENGWTATRTVHLIAFAAEEGGLIGSRDLVQRKYMNGAVPMMTMLQLEMNGYQARGRQIVVIEDGQTSTELSMLLNSYVTEYADSQYVLKNEACGYGCSDHSAFHSGGYRVTCIAEAGPFGFVNPHMHTSRDTLEHVTIDASLQHAKLALAYIVELSAAPFS